MAVTTMQSRAFPFLQAGGVYRFFLHLDFSPQTPPCLHVISQLKRGGAWLLHDVITGSFTLVSHL